MFLALLLLLGGCASPSQLTLNPELEHRKELAFCVGGYGCFIGVGVVPARARYNVELAPRNEDNIDRVIFSTCHRTKPYYNDELPKVDLPLIGKMFGKKKRGFIWEYDPTQGLEDTGDCDLYIYALDYESEDHAWGMLRIQNDKYSLAATLDCNGEGGRMFEGTSVCDAKAGTQQRIKFDRAVSVKTFESCAPFNREAVGEYTFEISKGKCPYLIVAQDGSAHSLLATGWETFKFEKR